MLLTLFYCTTEKVPITNDDVLFVHPEKYFSLSNESFKVSVTWHRSVHGNTGDERYGGKLWPNT